MDDIRIYNYARTPKQIIQDMNSGHTAVGSGTPIGYWKFDEGYGSTAHNSGTLGSGFDGTYNNSDGSTYGSGWINEGKYNKALQFDGLDDQIYINDPNDTINDNGTGITVSVWFNNRDLPQPDTNEDFWIASKYGWTSSTDNGGWYLEIQNSSGNPKLQFACTNVTDVWNGDSASIGFSDTNHWHHAVGTFDDATIKLYLDGKLVDSTAYTEGIKHDGYGLEIGSGASWTYYQGAIDEVKFYNYALNEDEVKTEYNHGSALVLGSSGTQGTISTASQSAMYITHNGQDDNSYGSLTWDTPSEIGGYGYNDGVFASATLNGNTNYTHYLHADTFGFSVPSNATIKGITLRVRRQRTGGSTGQARDKVVRLVKAGSVTGSDYAKTTINWANASEEEVIYGGDSSMWGDTWAPSDINNTNFGAVISATGSVAGTNRIANVDDVRISVSYVVPGSSAEKNSQTRGWCPPGDTSTCDPPVGYWTLDERQGTTANDSSGDSHDGTISTGTQWIPGKKGSGLSFDGIDDNIAIGDILDLDFAGDVPFTLEGWVNIKAYSPTRGSIISKYNRDVAGMWYLGEENNGQITLGRDCGNWNTNSNSTLSLNKWYHVVGLYDTSALKIYINGSLDISTIDSCTLVRDMAVSTVIGAADNGSGVEDVLNGKLDDIRVYNYARTPAQIAWDYNRGGPIGWWKFDECQGTTAYDGSGKGNNATIIPGDTSGAYDSAGSCNSGSGTEMWNAGTSGKFNSSLGLDGTNDMASASSSLFSSPMPQLSFFAWAKRSAITDYERIGGAYYWSSGNLGSWVLMDNGNGSLACSIQTDTGGWGAAATQINTFGQINRWYHVGCAYDGNNIKIYIDGKEKATSDFSGTIISTHYPFTIGATSTGPVVQNYFNGQIDDVRLYNYGLTSEQVKLLYNENAAVRFGPLTGSP